MIDFVLFTALLLGQAADAKAPAPPPPAPAPDPMQPAPGDPFRDLRETRLGRVLRLTNTGSNAEAYWSTDGKRIIFQSTRDGHPCDQLYTMNTDGSEQRRVSSGKGRVTCGWFLPGDKKILFASTHGAGPECPPSPPFTPGKYQWPVFQGYDLYLSNPDGSGAVPFLPAPGYDAEATVSPNGKWIVFTSERSGDVDLWRVDLDGRNLVRLTEGVGYDGGAVFSPDSKLIAWRTNYPKGAEAAAKYQALLKEHLVEPMEMDLWVMDADGKNKRQVTKLPGAAFAPIFTPDGKALLFSTNHHDREGKGRAFDLFKVNLDGTGLERITWTGTFNSFPHFSPDGRRLLFVSGRSPRGPRQFDVFVADWVTPGRASLAPGELERCTPKGLGGPR
ncbi:MAG: TolB family protein [Acidobacteria bacterium]|nr:TolB family protein [Acidobacteriota bacterium]